MDTVPTPRNPELDPRLTGDWDGYTAARRDALAPIQAERDGVTAEMERLSSRPQAQITDADEARYTDLQTRQRVLQTNMETTTPNFLSESGNFEPGDLDGFARQRGIDAMQRGRESNGLPPLSDEEAGAAFDRQYEAMTPQQRQAYMRDAETDYRSQRANEVAATNLQQRVGGVAGAALGAAALAGVLPLTPWSGRTFRRPAARPGVCPTCTPGGGPGAGEAARPAGPTTHDGHAIRRQTDAAPDARNGGEPVFRGDSRTPAEIRAAGGFRGQNPEQDATLGEHMAVRRPPSAWVSTTQDPDVAAAYAHNPFPLGATRQQHQLGGGYVYEIAQPGGVIVDRTSLARPVPAGALANREVAYSEPIPWSSVRRYAEVPANTMVTSLDGVPTVRWVPNPDYTGPR